MSFEECAQSRVEESILERLGIESLVFNWQKASISNARKYLPSPHSEILLGVTLGVDELNQIPKFNDVVRRTGTIHVIVVSGFNISLVFGVVIKLLGSRYQAKNLLIALGATFGYALITGFEPPVIRAWVMGSLAAIGKFEGRNLQILPVLYASCLFMLLWQPAFLFSLSFQLSSLATFGLIYYADIVEHFFTSLSAKVSALKLFINSSIFEDFTATVSAQIFVTPLLIYTFGELSLISVVANTLLLWTIPIATILGSVYIILMPISTVLARAFSFLVFVPIDIFVRGCYFFAKFPYAQVHVEISRVVLVISYGLAFVVPIILRKRFWHAS